MYIISMPKITVLSITLYMDKFGQGVQDLLKESREKLYSLDFNTMMLNAEGMKEIADIISQGHGINSKLFKIITGT